MKEIEFIDGMILRLRGIKADIKKRDKLFEKSSSMNIHDYTQKQFKKVNTDLNWQCMEVDKSITAFARAFKKSMLDVDTGPKEYNPSGWHNYKG